MENKNENINEETTCCEEENCDDVVEQTCCEEESAQEEAEEIDYKVKYLETLAAMDNLTKRVAQEQVEYSKYRAKSFLENILPTLDMFEMALKAEVSEEIKN